MQALNCECEEFVPAVAPVAVVGDLAVCGGCEMQLLNCECGR